MPDFDFIVSSMSLEKILSISVYDSFCIRVGRVILGKKLFAVTRSVTYETRTFVVDIACTIVISVKKVT